MLPDGYIGYAGNLEVSVRFELTEANGLRTESRASTDAPTLCNFKTHKYCNFDGGADTRDYYLRVKVDQLRPGGNDCIPTGEIAAVPGSRFDFKKSDSFFSGNFEELDHSFCLNESGYIAAAFSSTRSYIWCELMTADPGLQVYTGQAASAPPIGPFAGNLLEPQIWPFAPNQPEFHGAVLHPGEFCVQPSVFRLTKRGAGLNACAPEKSHRPHRLAGWVPETYGSGQSDVRHSTY